MNRTLRAPCFSTYNFKNYKFHQQLLVTNVIPQDIGLGLHICMSWPWHLLEHKFSLSWFSWSTIAKAFENHVLPLRLNLGYSSTCVPPAVVLVGCAHHRCGVLVSPIGMYAVGLGVSIRMELGFKLADVSLSRVYSNASDIRIEAPSFVTDHNTNAQHYSPPLQKYPLSNQPKQRRSRHQRANYMLFQKCHATMLNRVFYILTWARVWKLQYTNRSCWEMSKCLK